MVELIVLQGYCTIQLYWKVGGSNRWPETIVWAKCGNVLVDEDDFPRLRYDASNEEIRWLRRDILGTGSYIAFRVKKINGKTIHIYMSREVLGLPHGVGFSSGVGDHKNHDTRDNSKENLRNATNSQSQWNKGRYSSRQEPKGVRRNKSGSGYEVHIAFRGERIWFRALLSENEAWFLRGEAVKAIHGEHAWDDVMPEDQMPTPERQQRLREMVIEKLRVFGLI